MKLQDFIRIILTFSILFGVYDETGFYTTAALFMIFVSIEIIAVKIRYNKLMYEHISDVVKEMLKLVKEEI